MPVMSASSVQRRFRGSQEITRSYKGGALIWQKPSVIAPFGYVTRRTATGAALSRIFPAVELGTPSPARDVYVGIPLAATTNGQVTAVTIAGVPATLEIKQGAEGGAWNVFTSLWHARVPAGAVGEIQVDHTTNVSHTTILVFAGDNVTVASSRATGGGAGATTVTASLPAVPAGYRIYAFGAAWAASSLTWTGANEVFEETPIASSLIGMAEGTAVAGTNAVNMTRVDGSRTSMIAFAAI